MIDLTWRPVMFLSSLSVSKTMQNEAFNKHIFAFGKEIHLKSGIKVTPHCVGLTYFCRARKMNVMCSSFAFIFNNLTIVDFFFINSIGKMSKVYIH